MPPTAVPPSLASSSLQDRLAAFLQRRNELLGYLGSAEEEIEALRARGEHVDGLLLRSCERWSAAYWAIHTRFEKLHALRPDWDPFSPDF